MKLLRLFPLLLSPVLFLSALSFALEPDPSRRIDRIAFGSCARQAEPQPIWKAIQDSRPDLFIWTGDNVYADTQDADKLRKSYALLGAIEGYRSLKRSVPVVATWDDHDYGKNDAGVEFSFKETSQKIFLDFFEAPPLDDRRQRGGVYTSYRMGPPGQVVQVILLDTRYFRSPLTPMAGKSSRYRRDKDPLKTMLGQEQWKWLEEELKKQADVRFLVSSIQVIADEHPFEKWGNLPLEQTKLFGLIRNTKAKRVVFLSGDRHFAELSVLKGAVDYPLYDFTSSSLNAPIGNRAEPNRHRLAVVMGTPNFGLIRIDWDLPEPRLTMEIRDDAGKVHAQQQVSLSELEP